MSAQVDKALDVIAGTIGMPKRLLVGSERGELASSQDENNWGTVTSTRQKNYTEPLIVRQFLDRGIQYRVLPRPQAGYLCTWPDPKPLTEQEQALVARTWTETYAAYAKVSATPIEQIVPIEIWLEDTCGWSKEQVARMTDLVDATVAEIAAEDAETEEQEMPEDDTAAEETAA
jgi:hypothetical protein